VDVERAKAGPFGAPIAHGFLTLSLLPRFFESSMTIRETRMGVNYGLNKVRFTSPVPVGSRLRARMKLLACEPIDNNGMQMTWEVTTEREGVDKPVCIALSLKTILPPGFKHGYCDCVGQVEAALARQAWAISGIVGAQSGRTASDRPRVSAPNTSQSPGLKGNCLEHLTSALGCQRKQRSGAGCCVAKMCRPVSAWRCTRGVLVVIQPSAAHVRSSMEKPSGSIRCRCAARIGRQADDVARIGRNFGFDQNDMKHGLYCRRSLCACKNQRCDVCRTSATQRARCGVQRRATGHDVVEQHDAPMRDQMDAPSVGRPRRRAPPARRRSSFRLSVLCGGVSFVRSNNCVVHFRGVQRAGQYMGLVVAPFAQPLP
jgi:hypothetical protein